MEIVLISFLKYCFRKEIPEVLSGLDKNDFAFLKVTHRIIIYHYFTFLLVCMI